MRIRSILGGESAPSHRRNLGGSATHDPGPSYSVSEQGPHCGETSTPSSKQLQQDTESARTTMSYESSTSALPTLSACPQNGGRRSQDCYWLISAQGWLFRIRSRKQRTIVQRKYTAYPTVPPRVVRVMIAQMYPPSPPAPLHIVRPSAGAPCTVDISIITPNIL